MNVRPRTQAGRDQQLRAIVWTAIFGTAACSVIFMVTGAVRLGAWLLGQ